MGRRVNAVDLSVSASTDGFAIAGGDTARELKLKSGNVEIVASGSHEIYFPSASTTLVGTDTYQILTNKIITGSITTASYALNAAGGAVSAIDDLSDVLISGTPANLELLVWKDANWQNQTRAEAQVAPTSHSHTEAQISDLHHEVAVKWAGSTIGTRAGINFLTGSGISMSFQDNAGSDHVNVWINADVGAVESASYALTSSLATMGLEQLDNVLISGTPANLELLVWKDANWQNQTRAEAQIAPVSHSHTEAQISDLHHEVVVKQSNSTKGTRAGINFIPGTNISMSVVDNSGLDHVNVTVYADLEATYDIDVDTITGSNFKATATTASLNLNAGSHMWHRVGNNASASLASVIWGSGSTPPATAPTGTIYFQL